MNYNENMASLFENKLHNTGVSLSVRWFPWKTPYSIVPERYMLNDVQHQWSAHIPCGIEANACLAQAIDEIRDETLDEVLKSTKMIIVALTAIKRFMFYIDLLL